MNTLNSIPESIYDTLGSAAGSVYQGADGLFYLYNLKGEFMGTFNPVLNATYTAYGKFLDYGNQLRALVGL